MGFKWCLNPKVCVLPIVSAAFFAGYCYAESNPLWMMWVAISLFCSLLMIRRVARQKKRIRFLMESALSGDFSYKFPTAGVNRDEAEINDILNRIVKHLESLSLEARQNEVFLRRIINLTGVGVAVVDGKGNVVLHNDAVLRMFERAALTHVCQIPEQIYSDLSVRKCELTVNDKSFTLYTFSDLRQQLQKAEVESWEKLTRVLTHEIMNSLTPIQSIAENMSHNAPLSEAAGAFETISSSSRSLMQFIKNFREFAKLPEPRMRALYLKPLLESCVRMGREFAKDKDIKFECSCFPPDLMVYTDESLLGRVFINIIKNAVEANPSTIKIEARLSVDESVEIRIYNDGDPIPEEVRDQIFTPFYTTRKEGSGIGLSLSRRIVNRLGGTLSFRTGPVTCFTVRI